MGIPYPLCPFKRIAFWKINSGWRADIRFWASSLRAKHTFLTINYWIIFFRHKQNSSNSPHCITTGIGNASVFSLNYIAVADATFVFVTFQVTLSFSPCRLRRGVFTDGKTGGNNCKLNRLLVSHWICTNLLNNWRLSKK